MFLVRLSMWNMLSCAERVQIQKYKTQAYKTLKTACVQTIMLKHPTKQLKFVKKITGLVLGLIGPVSVYYSWVQ